MKSVMDRKVLTMSLDPFWGQKRKWTPPIPLRGKDMEKEFKIWGFFPQKHVTSLGPEVMQKHRIEVQQESFMTCPKQKDTHNPGKNQPLQEDSRKLVSRTLATLRLCICPTRDRDPTKRYTKRGVHGSCSVVAEMLQW